MKIRVGRTIRMSHYSERIWGRQWYWMCQENCPSGWGRNFGGVDTWQDAMHAAIEHLKERHS